VDIVLRPRAALESSREGAQRVFWISVIEGLPSYWAKAVMGPVTLELAMSTLMKGVCFSMAATAAERESLELVSQVMGMMEPFCYAVIR
jgi:hypothetical protein